MGAVEIPLLSNRWRISKFRWSQSVIDSRYFIKAPMTKKKNDKFEELSFNNNNNIKTSFSVNYLINIRNVLFYLLSGLVSQIYFLQFMVDYQYLFLKVIMNIKKTS